MAPSNMAKVAQNRINQNVSNPATPRSKMPATPPTRNLTPGVPRGVVKAPKPVTNPKTPKPFQPGFVAGKSGKVPPGLARAALNRLNRKTKRMTRKTK